MTQDLQQTIALLDRTPRVLKAWLHDLPEAWVDGNEGAATWNVVEVLGHLVYGDQCDWMTRTRTILEHGEARTFEPFDMQGHVSVIQGRSLNELLDEFAELRASNLAELKRLALDHEQLDLRGTHPAFGSVRLGEMLATWAVHDLSHIHQISRVMAYQYRELVGPWSAYLGVLGNKQAG